MNHNNMRGDPDKFAYDVDDEDEESPVESNYVSSQPQPLIVEIAMFLFGLAMFAGVVLGCWEFFKFLVGIN